MERYDPLRHIELSERARAAGAASATHLLANLIGLAVPANRKTDAESGLLPPAVRAARSFRRRQPRLLGAAGLAALALLPPLWHYHSAVTRDLAQTAEIRAQLPALQARVAADATNLKKIAAARRQLSACDRLLRTRSSWVSFIADLQDRLATVEDVWLGTSSRSFGRWRRAHPSRWREALRRFHRFASS